MISSTFDYPEVLRYAIESVRRQSYVNHEHIVVGDGCGPETERLVAECAKRDPRLRWLGLEQNSGSQSMPNNAGIAAARGNWIAYLGHDDLWGPHHLAWLLETIEREQTDGAFSLLELIGPGTSGRWLAGLPGRGVGDMDIWTGPSALMHAREVAERAGGWRDYRETELLVDLDFLLRAHNGGARFASSRAITAFKFPAGMRRNVYRAKPSHEQQAQLRRIYRERLFAWREMARLGVAWSRRDPDERNPREMVDEEVGPGSWARAARAFKGLDKDPPTDVS